VDLTELAQEVGSDGPVTISGRGTRGGPVSGVRCVHAPQGIEWMPCYCGCVKLDHRSNLDCYLKRPAAGASTQFDQHASFCGICVQTTLLAQQMSEQGKSLKEIRQAVDQQFGGSTPGTDTAQPPG
jgi:hypothetical protein